MCKEVKCSLSNMRIIRDQSNKVSLSILIKQLFEVDLVLCTLVLGKGPSAFFHLSLFVSGPRLFMSVFLVHPFRTIMASLDRMNFTEISYEKQFNSQKESRKTSGDLVLEFTMERYKTTNSSRSDSRVIICKSSLNT